MTDGRIISDAERRAAGLPVTKVHTCHADCPCHEGKEPMGDFIEARTQLSPTQAIWAGKDGKAKELRRSAKAIVKSETGQSHYEATREAHIRADERRRIVALIESVRLVDYKGKVDEHLEWNQSLKRCLTAIREEEDHE